MLGENGEAGNVRFLWWIQFGSAAAAGDRHAPNMSTSFIFLYYLINN